MKAITFSTYGGPEVLALAELPQPTPGEGQVLVKVHATSLNAADWRLMRADPFLTRLMNGLFAPKKRRVLGSDVAGVVVGLGKGVQRFVVGDEVFGETPMDANGALAEFTLVAESRLVKKPRGVRFEDAAAVPLAGTTALQALKRAKAGPGTRVLIQGAGGGVGLFAVQVARQLGAEVTAVCGPQSVELVRSFGVHACLDYTQRDFTREGQQWDAIVAVNGYHSLAAYGRCLSPGGRYVMVGGTSAQLFEALLFARPFFALQRKQGGALTIDVAQQGAELQQLAEWLGSGALRVVLEQRYPLERAAEAMAHLERGHVRGKVVVCVTDEP